MLKRHQLIALST